MAALDAVRARLTGPGYFGDEARRDLLVFMDMAHEALEAGGPDAAPSAVRPAEALELRIGLLVLRAQVDDLLAKLEARVRV